MTSLTAAHPTLPIPSYARVTNVQNGKSLIVRVNDRGPYHGNRLIDVSNKAAELLEFKANGVAKVRVEYVGRAPLEGFRRPPAHGDASGPARPAPSPVHGPGRFGPPVCARNIRRCRVNRGEVPMPEGRPYSLGNRFGRLRLDQRDVGCRPPAAHVAVLAENPRAVSYENDATYDAARA